MQDAADPTFSVDDKAKYAELWCVMKHDHAVLVVAVMLIKY